MITKVSGKETIILSINKTFFDSWNNCRFNLGLLLLFLFAISAFGQQEKANFPEIIPSILRPAMIDYDDGEDPMNSRLFRTTTIRTQVDLTGNWEFLVDPGNTGEQNNYFKNFPAAETNLWVPGTWNAIARYWQYQGVAWYHRTFDLKSSGNIRIRFGGVFYKCKIWVDGEIVGEHEGGYTPFAYVLRKFRDGQHSIVVRVDNSLNEETVPKVDSDWFPYGGMYRPVYLEKVSDYYIDQFHIIPKISGVLGAELFVKVFTRNLAGGTVNKQIKFYVNGNLSFSGSRELGKGADTLEFKMVLKDAKLWSPDSPYLYSARVVLGDGEDDQFVRFGIREFTKGGYKVFLNGERFKLMGADHHEDHPDWGSAMPPHLVRQDIEIYKRARANAARGHYPPAELFLDYCDEQGILFMNEVPVWQQNAGQLANPTVITKIEQQFYDMVYRDMNHPSIFSWSLGNEWMEYHKAYRDIKQLVDYARSIDRSHFLTFVVGGASIDSCINLIDLYCTNWHKYHWYWKETTPQPDVAAKRIAQLDKVHEAFPQKPIILTEFGGAGSQAGWHNWGNVKWSEEFQAINVYESGEIALKTDWMSGGCVWQFCDTRSAPQRMLASRLRGWNVKGILDGFRQPKLAFYKLQQLFTEFAKDKY